jgi:phospholipid/cholesterol/gamma-HCH transport system substrate-binding protein
VEVLANQAGLIGETAIDLIPKAPLADVALGLSPLKNCNPQLILCDQGDRPDQKNLLAGKVGASFPELLRSTDDFTKAYSDPEFTKKVEELTVSANATAKEIANLSRELLLLSRAVRQEMQGLGNSSRQLIATSNDTMKRAGRTADEFARLAQSLDATVQENRRSLNATLVSIGQTSDQMRLTLKRVDGTLAKADTDAIFRNLEELTRNAAAASADVKVMTQSLGDPATILTLQKTLDSARATFENTQKITSDIDELTGNPEFRRNLIQLINGLSQLVSSSQQLERQMQIAQSLEPMRQNLKAEQQQWAQQQSLYRDLRRSQLSTRSPRSFTPTNKTPKPEQFH